MSVAHHRFAWWPLLLAIMSAFLLLCALGVWQLARKAEKDKLIGAIATRSAPPAQALWPQAAWRDLTPEVLFFQRVTLTGQFRPVPVFRLYTVQEDAAGQAQAGWLLLTPLDVDGGGIILVNRGRIAPDAALPVPPAGRVQIEGWVRPREVAGWFAAADNPAANAWYTRDPQMMALSASLGAVAPFSLDQISDNPGGVPVIVPRPPVLPNRHLEYAITWLALALTLLVVSSLFITERLKRRSA